MPIHGYLWMNAWQAEEEEASRLESEAQAGEGFGEMAYLPL